MDKKIKNKQLSLHQHKSQVYNHHLHKIAQATLMIQLIQITQVQTNQAQTKVKISNLNNQLMASKTYRVNN